MGRGEWARCPPLLLPWVDQAKRESDRVLERSHHRRNERPRGKQGGTVGRSDGRKHHPSLLSWWSGGGKYSVSVPLFPRSLPFHNPLFASSGGSRISLPRAESPFEGIPCCRRICPNPAIVSTAQGQRKWWKKARSFALILLTETRLRNRLR
ncbi:hypothetical protein BDM02DRAFT_3106490 [Thelephora ganbajun]|uniref:Uncharacterized protein n=1 Tax=Thelephora ganbajun TaxID=370292 RepID=A0ACB6ZX21_THEGA|nr:hypothetical protein BDM02DRAFT_3106490 [Thelephora ganbajun]